MSDDMIIGHALGKHPDCNYGEVVNGMDMMFRITRVVKLWRDIECASAGDPPRHVVEGYPR